MNKKILIGAVVLVISLAFVIPANAKPTTFSVNYNQAQFQWRAADPLVVGFGGPFGDWSGSYQNYATSSDFTLTGNALHSTFTFSPIVTNIEAASTVYTFDKSSGLWVEHAGSLTYNIPGFYCLDTSLPVCNGPYVNFWTGYLNFGGNTPSTSNFVHGVGYQWIYYFAPQSDTSVTANIPYAQWDAKVGAWLIGLSIYLWDSGTQSYDMIPVPATDNYAFPNPFIEPLPANNYNPLGL